MVLSGIVDNILDYISPKKCYSCLKEGHYICPTCLTYFQNFDSLCYVCKWKSDNFQIHQKCKKASWEPYFDKVIILYHYKSNPLKKLLHDAKYYKIKSIYDDFTILLSQKLKQNYDISKQENFLISCPPMHWRRKLYRWYNQSEYLWKLLWNSLNLDTNFKLLKKRKYTVHQSHLSKTEREKNLDQAFVFNSKFHEQVEGKSIIIIDDVVSTGSTISECSKVLKQNGAQEVIALIIASD